MHPLVAEVVRAHAEAEVQHRKFYELVRLVHRAIRSAESELTQADRADLIYILKQVLDIWQDLKKETQVDIEVLENIFGVVFVTKAAETAGKKPTNVKGTIATVTPRMTVQPAIPSPTKEPTKYRAMMEGLGVTNEEVLTRGILRPHWPSMTEWCTELSEKGLPLPKGVDPSKSNTGFATTARKRPDRSLDDIRKEADEAKAVIYNDSQSTERIDF